MNNGDASTKHLVRNNCKGGEMGNDNKNKSIKEKLSGCYQEHRSRYGRTFTEPRRH
ncbi:MAG: hypothetical protein ACR5LB_09155 [Wolbachia sp.]